ncbi:MAG: hypothetical protein ACLT64_08365 [Streptococcus salivarius]
MNTTPTNLPPGDGIWILTAIAVLLALKLRNSFGFNSSVVGFYAVIVSIAKGQDILKAVGWFFDFGIESDSKYE